MWCGFRLVCGVWLCFLTAAACRSSAESTPNHGNGGNGSGQGGDAGSNGGAGGAGGAGGGSGSSPVGNNDGGVAGEDSGTGGADDEPSGPLHFPEAELVNITPNSGGGLKLLASKLVVSSDQAGDLARWYFFVRNDGPEPLCSVELHGSFKSAAGDELLSTASNVSGPMHAANGRRECLSPTQVGGGASADTLFEVFETSEVARIEYFFNAAIVPSAVPADDLVMGETRAERVDDSEERWVVRGAIENTGTLVSNAMVTAYPKNPAGMPLGIELLTAPQAIANGGTWLRSRRACG